MIQAFDTGLELDVLTTVAMGWQPYTETIHGLRPAGTSVATYDYDYDLGPDATLQPYDSSQAQEIISMPHQTWHSDDGMHMLKKDTHTQQAVLDPPRSNRQHPPHTTRRHIHPAEWASRRAEITELYRHRNWTLPRVMQEMARRGFHASYAIPIPSFSPNVLTHFSGRSNTRTA